METETEERPIGCCGGGKNAKGPPIDRGWAWMVCFACWVLYYVCMGVNKSLGIILVIMQNEFQSDPSITSIIVSMAAAGIFLFVSMSNGFGVMIGYRPMTCVGAIIVTLAMVVTAFAPNILTIIFSLGLVSGIGYSAVYGPPTVVLSMYFAKRRAIAMGIAMTGGSVGAITIPLLLQYLLKEYGFQGAMLILAGILAHSLPAALLLRPLTFYTRRRTGPNSEPPPRMSMVTTCKRIFDKELLRNPLFIHFVVGLIITQGGYMGSIAFLPTIFNEVFDDPNLAFLVSTVIGVSDLVGRLVFGFLADVKSIPTNYILGLNLIIPGVICLVAYFFVSKAMMLTAVVAIGMLAGAYVPLLGPIIVEYFGLQKVSASFGLCTLFMGIIVIPLPITMAELGKAAGYLNVFLFGAVMLLVGGVIAMPLDLTRRVLAKRAQSKSGAPNNTAGDLYKVSDQGAAIDKPGATEYKHDPRVVAVQHGDVERTPAVHSGPVYSISGQVVHDSVRL